jgi:hypothetical protein
LIFAGWTIPGQSQTTEDSGADAQYPPYSRDIGRPRDDRDQAEQKMQREQQKKLNQERQAQLKRDTDKLFQLATQLKDAVDKSNENTLSLEVIKKAGEIEKLAKSVREKMRGQN